MSHSTGGGGYFAGSGGATGGHLTGSRHLCSVQPTYAAVPKRKLLESILVVGDRVTFPTSTDAVRLYMRPFIKDVQTGEVLLPSDCVDFLTTVEQMLAGIVTKETMFLMVDRAYVKAGQTHRRPGAHVDGNWIAADDDKEFREMYPETIILASDVAGCVGHRGKYADRIGKGGQCDSVNFDKLERVIMKPNRAYLGNVYMIHESIPVTKTCVRTLIRINVPRHELQQP